MGRPPVSFNGFFGQRPAVRILRRHLRGSKALGLAPGPILLLGESGYGKTALARAAAAENGVELKVLIADGRVRDYELTERLDALRPGDMQLIDEIQELGPDDQMELCAWIDRSRPDCSGRPSSSTKACAIIAATDRPGSLLRPLYRRFTLRIHLQPYSSREMVLIARKRAAEKQLLVSSQALRMIAETCRGVPRLCGDRLELLRRHWADRNVDEFKASHVRRFFEAHGIGELGLERLDIHYLRFLAEMGKDGASLKSLGMALTTDPGYLSRHVEPYLVQLGLLRISVQRILTQTGVALVEGLK